MENQDRAMAQQDKLYRHPASPSPNTLEIPPQIPASLRDNLGTYLYTLFPRLPIPRTPSSSLPPFHPLSSTPLLLFSSIFLLLLIPFLSLDTLPHLLCPCCYLFLLIVSLSFSLQYILFYFPSLSVPPRPLFFHLFFPTLCPFSLRTNISSANIFRFKLRTENIRRDTSMNINKFQVHRKVRSLLGATAIIYFLTVSE